MTISRTARGIAVALALAVAPALAVAATPAEQQAPASHDCSHRDCGCRGHHDAQAKRVEATPARDRTAEDAFVQQVWTAP